MAAVAWDNKITLGNVLTIGAMLATVIGSYLALKIDVLAAGKDIATLQMQITPVPTIATRLALVESNQTADRDRAQDLRAAIEDLRRQNVDILQRLSGIAAKLEVAAAKPTNWLKPS